MQLHECPAEISSQILSSFQNASFVAMFLDENFKVIYYNHGASLFFENTDIYGKDLLSLFPNLDENTVKYYLNHNLVYNGMHYFSPTLSNIEGRLPLGKTLHINILPLGGEMLNFSFLLGFDITEYVAIISSLELALRYDNLTGLLNLSSFLEEAQASLLQNPRYAVMIVLDLFNFSAINDTYGLRTGDNILKELADRLKISFESSAIISRTSADEFAFFIRSLEHRKEVTQYLDFIELIFNLPFRVDDGSITIPYNLGLSIYPMDGRSSEVLYREAQLACSLAKKKGPNQVEFFDPALFSYLQQTIAAEKLIESALDNHWFNFFLQPYFSVGSSFEGYNGLDEGVRLVGAEALVRIVKPEGEIIPPGKFISQLERSIYLERFEKWAFRTLVELINSLKIPLALNLYPSTFYNQSFWKQREKDLQSLAAPLVLEITERATLEDPNKAKEVMLWLKSFPMVRIALDDFGTGYSNLSYLKDLPLDIIKVDMSFVRALTQDDKKTKSIVKTIIDLAHAVSAKALAEGVETEVQMKILVDLGCDYLQGFYFEKPIAIADFVSKYLSERAKA